jgi:hypothetical protein
MKKELLIFSTKRLHIRPIERKDFRVWKQGIEGTRPPQSPYDADNIKNMTTSFSSFLAMLKGDKLRISQGQLRVHQSSPDIHPSCRQFSPHRSNLASSDAFCNLKAVIRNIAFICN